MYPTSCIYDHPPYDQLCPQVSVFVQQEQLQADSFDSYVATTTKPFTSTALKEQSEGLDALVLLRSIDDK